MGKLEDKFGTRKEEYYFEPQKQELPQEKYVKESGVVDKVKKKFKNFGFTRNSYSLATDIENNPTPEGVMRKTFSGRPLDLHMLEDYLVWKTSPLAIKTILRYGHAKTIEDIRGLLSAGDRAKGNPKTMIMIILAIILLVGGVLFLLYGPQLSSIMGG